MLKRLRILFATGHKDYLLTGAPQCVVPDASMGNMIAEVVFDIIFIQFYNTPFCSARNFIATNRVNSGFSYDEWSQFLAGTASASAKLYVGLPASPVAAGGEGVFWLNPVEAKALIQKFAVRDNFGGVMLWEATMAEHQVDQGKTYYQNIKSVLREIPGASPLAITSPVATVAPILDTDKTGTGDIFEGDITYYYPGGPGFGVCGGSNYDNDAICAVSRLVFDGFQEKDVNPNENPICGKKIRVSRKDERDGKMKSIDVTVVDRCEGCEPADLDLSPGMFDKLAARYLGRVNAEWEWLE